MEAGSGFSNECLLSHVMSGEDYIETLIRGELRDWFFTPTVGCLANGIICKSARRENNIKNGNNADPYVWTIGISRRRNEGICDHDMSWKPLRVTPPLRRELRKKRDCWQALKMMYAFSNPTNVWISQAQFREKRLPLLLTDRRMLHEERADGFRAFSLEELFNYTKSNISSNMQTNMT